MLNAFFAFKTNNFILSDMNNDPLAPAKLLFLATLGDAQVLGLDIKVGDFIANKAFDALWVDLNSGSLGLMGGETIQEKVEKFMFNGSTQNLKHVYVQGRRVAGRE